MNPRSSLNGRIRRRPIDRRLAAWMLARPHVAITRHLLAASHLGLRHLRGWQTCQRGRGDPRSQQEEDDHGAYSRHS